MLRGVSFGYEAGEPVVSEVSATLEPGRLCCLIGPNAAGKSTLMKLMLGQLRPWRGSLELGGRPLARLRPIERARRVSYVPQRGAMGFAFTVRQVVEMGRFAAGPSPEVVNRAMALCDLEKLAGRVYAHLSGGQQQRALIARALAQAWEGGELMLLDEPGSSLDLWHVHRLMQLLREQARQGRAVLMAVHDLNLAARYADEVWLMDRGRMKAAGSWREVLRPELLEAVYRVGLTPLRGETGGRPVFRIEPIDTLSGSGAAS